MNNNYTNVTIASNEVELILPKTKNVYLIKCREHDFAVIKSKEKSVRVIDDNNKLIGLLMPFEEKTIKIVKPKWWQIIKRMKGEKLWKIV